MSDSQVTVLAQFKSIEGKETQLKELLVGLLEPTRNEDGCINYDLHEDPEDKTRFMFYENWESKEQLKKHMNSEHITMYRPKAAELVEEKEISIWRKS